MLVARSFKYNSLPMDRVSETSHRERRDMRRDSSNMPRRPSFPDPAPPKWTPTEPVTIPSSKPVHVSQSQRDQHTSEVVPQFRSATMSGRPKKSPAHDPNALSPSVAALLAVTAIPRRSKRFRGRPGSDRKISIDELVNEWKSDDSLKSSYGTSPVLSALLEDTDDGEDQLTRSNSAAEEMFLQSRSSSSDSMPSLDADDGSIVSGGSPSTPESLRSRRSITNLKKPRAIMTVEDCAFDHPLVIQSDINDEDFDLETQKREPVQSKPRSSFKSNLTASLQNLKNAAINSITSLGRTHQSHHLATPPIDQMLWSHPFLFPRFSSEIRPATDSAIVSESQRHFLNTLPLTFEEQEAPFQQALHAPYLAEGLSDFAGACAPRIPMQTYNRTGNRRGRSSNNSSRRGPDPNSEAGRALLGAAGVRHREIRENSDFLRVVVLEMNMRREGKLESGKARIWLPPREMIAPFAVGQAKQVPNRWVGVSAY